MSGSEEEFIPEEEAEVGPAALKKLRERLAECKKEKQEYLEGWQRSRADFANAKRQFDEDRGSFKELAASVAAKEFLPALDSLERAKAAGKLPEDFAGIARQLEEGFAALGVAPIAPNAGDAFEPREHEALQQSPVEDAEKDGTITKVLEAGWRIGETVLRPARVAVGVHQKEN